MKIGTSTGVLDEFLATICVGDEIVDKAGSHYTINRFGRAKPTNGGNEVPLKSLEGVTVCKSWAGHAESITKAAEAKVKAVVDDFYGNKPEVSEEEKELELIDTYVHAAGDQRLVDELRKRGWTVSCTKITEKIVYEEVVL